MPLFTVYDAAPLDNTHGYMYAKMGLAVLAALLQSAPLQNNGGMFRPVTIPQYLSEEGEPEIIQAVLISHWILFPYSSPAS